MSPSLSAEALDAHITTLITAAPSTITHTQATHIIKGLKWLGLVSESTPVTRRGNYLDCLCAALEAKMMYKDGERDMVMLQHTFYIEWADGKKVREKWKR